MALNMETTKKYPYDKAYLEPLQSVHRLLFAKIAEQTEYDCFSMIDA